MNKILTGLLLLILIFTGSPAVIGQAGNPERAPMEFTTARGEALRAGCATVLEGLNQFSQTIQAGQSRWFDLHNEFISSLGEFSNQAESNDIDTTALNEHIAEIANLSGQLSSAWQETLTILNLEEQNIECESDDFEPKDLHDIIESAKTAHEELKSLLGSFIEAADGEIRTELAHIRGQL